MGPTSHPSISMVAAPHDAELTGERMFTGRRSLKLRRLRFESTTSSSSSIALFWTVIVASIGCGLIAATELSSPSSSLPPGVIEINNHRHHHYHRHHHHQHDCVKRIRQADNPRNGCLTASEFSSAVWEMASHAAVLHQTGEQVEEVGETWHDVTSSSNGFFSLPLGLKEIFFEYTTSSENGKKDDGPPRFETSTIHSDSELTVSCHGIELDRPLDYLEGICRRIEYHAMRVWYEEPLAFTIDAWVAPAQPPRRTVPSKNSVPSRQYHLPERLAFISSLTDEEKSSSPPGTSERIHATATATATATRKLQTVQQCKIALAIGDGDRNDILAQEEEYLRYVNQLSGQQYGSASSFSDLPQALQENYDSYADPSVGGIDIAGSKPGQTPTDTQDEQINALCAATIAILDGDTQAPASTEVPTPAASGGSLVSVAPAAATTGDRGALDCTGAITRDECNTALAIADLSREDLLSEDEFLRFVNRLSSNQYDGESFESLPGNILDVFDKFATSDGQINVSGSKPGQTTDDVQDQFIDDLCCEVDLAIGDPSAPTQPTAPPASVPTSGPPAGETPSDAGGDFDCSGTIERTQCNTDLSIADLSRDDLLDESEYVRFVNRLSNDEYAGQSFDDLPSNIQDNYDKFATAGGQVNVFGSKPGQAASSEEDEFLDSFCCETDLAVQNPGSATEPQPSLAPGPTKAPAPTESLPPTFDETFCRTSMASSDFNRDDQLNEEEYVRFLNRLTSNQFADLTLDQLDPVMQQNFKNLAGSDDQIDITGSKPGQTASSDQEAFLDQVCLDTAIALNGVGEGETPTTSGAPVESPKEPTSSPGVQPTFPPTFAEATCNTAMASSDFNRDDYMNEEEYVRFLNRLTSNQFEGLAFADLSKPLQETYNDLAAGSSNGEVYIFGSKPGQTATEEQQAFLGRVCLDVAVALGAVGGGGTLGPAAAPNEMTPPTNPPSNLASSGGEGPGTKEPTFPPGTSEVYNSFIVANTVGLTANDLQSGANRDGLNEAYGDFAMKSVNQIVAVQSRNLSRLSHLRRRKLVVDFSSDSDEIYLLIDSSCPEEIPERNTCQTAFAKFQISITDEDPLAISDEYTAATQVLITDGLLQTILTESDPRNVLTVVNSSFPVTSTFPPTPSPEEPTDSPTATPVDGNVGGGGSIAGPIVGGVIGGLLFCAAVGYVSTKGLPFSLPSFGSGKGRGKQTDDEDDAGFGQDDDASAGEKDGLGRGHNEFGDEDERGPEQSRDDKNVFGFGKKNKPGNANDRFGDDDEFGMESDAAEQADSFGKAGGMYAFDEPSEVADRADDQDQGSVGVNDDMFGVSPESPGWGNANNAFASNNQGWGANGTDPTNSGGGDNFFGASAFVEEEREGSRSGSESDSYTSSEDSTYESNGLGEEVELSRDDGDNHESGRDEEDSYSRSSADHDDRSESSNSESTPASMESDLRKKNEDMDAAIASEDWDAVAKAATSFGKGRDSSLERSSRKESDADADGPRGDSAGEEDSNSVSSRSGSLSESGDAFSASATTTSEDLEKRAEFRAQVDALVRLVLPDETDKVDAMMEQFRGREAELVSTLQTMQERSVTQRARAAVHKSKTRPQRPDGADKGAGGGQGGEGSAAGTAAIAAASLPIPAAGMFEDDGDAGFSGQDTFGEDERDADDYGDDEEGSYYSDEEGEEVLHDDEGSGSGSRSRYSDEEGPFSDEGSRNQYDDESSRSRRSGEEGSRSQYSSRSRRSGEEGSRSQYSGDGSRSYYSNEGSRSDRSGEDSRSYRSGDGSRSRRSGDSGSGPYSDEASRSQYSDEHSGSKSRSQSQRSYDDDGGPPGDEGPFSDEESRSRYSDEEREISKRSGDDRSYDDEEGSFTGSQEGGEEEEDEAQWQ